MKAFVTFLMTVTASVSALADVSPMELRILQTRVFEKNPYEVYDAITALCEDRSLNPMGRFSQGGLTCLSISSPEFKVGFLGNVKVPPKQVFSIKFSCQRPCDLEDGEKTIVRIRVNHHADQIGQQEQSTDPADYDELFDAIAQYLFIEAIEWDPAVQY